MMTRCAGVDRHADTADTTAGDVQCFMMAAAELSTCCGSISDFQSTGGGGGGIETIGLTGVLEMVGTGATTALVGCVTTGGEVESAGGGYEVSWIGGLLVERLSSLMARIVRVRLVMNVSTRSLRTSAIIRTLYTASCVPFTRAPAVCIAGARFLMKGENLMGS